MRSLASIDAPDRMRQRHAAEASHRRPAAEVIAEKDAFIVDLDGVIWSDRGTRLLPGARDFIQWLQDDRKRFVFLTNSSDVTPEDLSERFATRFDIALTARDFYTSAMATASFVAGQTPGAAVFVLGGPALVDELRNAGIAVFNDYGEIMRAEKEGEGLRLAPTESAAARQKVHRLLAESPPPVDFVIMGEGAFYNSDTDATLLLEQAVTLVRAGARLVATNPDIYDGDGTNVAASTGALVKPIEAMAARQAYYVGKPNPLMLEFARQRLQRPAEGLQAGVAARRKTLIIGDRMDTDIRAGVESGIDTLLMLSGVSNLSDVREFGYRPTIILESLSECSLKMGEFWREESRFVSRKE